MVSMGETLEFRQANSKELLTVPTICRLLWTGLGLFIPKSLTQVFEKDVQRLELNVCSRRTKFVAVSILGSSGNLVR